ncbi:MAG: C2 family cysteine protease, partial [Pirellulales bacterium]
PAGAAAPGFSTSGPNASVMFHEAGSYNLKVAAAGITRTLSVIVDPTATTMSVTPGTVCLAEGAKQQFTAKVYDQFHNVLTKQPTITWTAAGGTITTGGLFAAGNAPGSFKVIAKSGSLIVSSAVTVQAPSGGLQNATLAKLLQSLDADGSVSRNDMIQMLHSVAANGAVTASELSDLKTILGEAAKLNMPGYVQVLAGDVINGNSANATFQGQTLGNLAAGSSATQLNDLVAKWFMGADEPALSDPSFVYKTAAGSLFPHTPSHNDEFQGELGDCYFISSLGTIADSNSATIENMIIDNGDGTYTVRFYTGTYGSSYNPSTGTWSDGFSSGAGTADYVTVDRELATTSSGMLVYADFGANDASSGNALWIPLLEKAYAEWNQTGKEGRNGQNSFAAIEGGWMATVDAQVLGHNATDYDMTDAGKQYAISALAAHEAVTIGTYTANYGLVASHAYAIIGFNSATDTFTLYNPWGSYQPGQLSWTQLEATCDGLVVATTAGSTAITSGIAKPSATVAVASADTDAAGRSTEVVTTAATPQNQSDAESLDARGAPRLLAVTESEDNFWLSAHDQVCDFAEGSAARAANEAAFAGDLLPPAAQIWVALTLAG